MAELGLLGLLALGLGIELLAEEVVQEGADDRDDGEAHQLLLARCHRGGQDVGSELELQRQDEPAAEAEADTGKAGLVIPHSGRQPEGLAKADDHAGDGDDLQQQLEQLHPVHHALFQARYLEHSGYLSDSKETLLTRHGGRFQLRVF